MESRGSIRSRDMVDEQQLRRVFKDIADDDGKITIDKLRAIVEDMGLDMTEDELQEMVDVADESGSGEVSYRGLVGMITESKPMFPDVKLSQSDLRRELTNLALASAKTSAISRRFNASRQSVTDTIPKSDIASLSQQLDNSHTYKDENDVFNNNVKDERKPVLGTLSLTSDLDRHSVTSRRSVGSTPRSNVDIDRQSVNIRRSVVNTPGLDSPVDVARQSVLSRLSVVNTPIPESNIENERRSVIRSYSVASTPRPESTLDNDRRSDIRSYSVASTPRPESTIDYDRQSITSCYSALPASTPRLESLIDDRQSVMSSYSALPASTPRLEYSADTDRQLVQGRRSRNNTLRSESDLSQQSLKSLPRSNITKREANFESEDDDVFDEPTTKEQNSSSEIEHGPIREKKLRKMFQNIADDEGKITPGKLQDIVRDLGFDFTEEEIQDMVEVADVNGEGQVSYRGLVTMINECDELFPEVQLSKADLRRELTVLAMMQENTELSLSNVDNEDKASLNESTHSDRDKQSSDSVEIDEVESNKRTDVNENIDTVTAKRVHKSERRQKDKRRHNGHRETDLNDNNDSEIAKRVDASESRRRHSRRDVYHKEIGVEKNMENETANRVDTSESRQHDSRRDIRHTSSRVSHVVKHSIDGEIATAVGVYEDDGESNSDTGNDLTDDCDFSKITEEDEFDENLLLEEAFVKHSVIKDVISEEGETYYDKEKHKHAKRTRRRSYPEGSVRSDRKHSDSTSMTREKGRRNGHSKQNTNGNKKSQKGGVSPRKRMPVGVVGAYGGALQQTRLRMKQRLLYIMWRTLYDEAMQNMQTVETQPTQLKKTRRRKSRPVKGAL